MARRPTRSQSRILTALIAKLTPELRAAFTAAIADIQAGVVWADLISALERGNIDAAIAALRIEPAAFQAYAQAKTGAYVQAGAVAATTMPSGLPGIRFDMTNPRAEAWIAENVGRHIADITEDAMQAVRAAILAGYAEGNHPHTIARDLAGRVVNGTRQGGIIGLDSGRAHRLRMVTQGMRTPEGVRGLVIDGAGGPRLRYKVNKATEARILRAWRAGTEVPEADRIISERQFSNALLKDRAETIAATETGQAVMSARDEEWRQMLARSNLPPEALIKTWRHHRGASTQHRPDHLAMGGTAVRGLEGEFVFPDGTRKKHALDGSGGAKHDARCGCSTDYRIDQTWGLQ